MAIEMKNKECLASIMKQCIADSIASCTPANKKSDAKSKKTEEACIPLSVVGDLLAKVTNKLSDELLSMVEFIDINAKEEREKMQVNFDNEKAELLNDIADLRNQVDNVGQYTRRDNIKLVGVPISDGEDVSQLVIDVVKHTGVNLEKEDISVAHRLNTRDDVTVADSTSGVSTKKKVASIICRLVHRTKKSEIFGARKEIKNKAGAPYPDAAIYDDVTPLRSRILFAMRNKKDINGEKVYKYVWSKEGRIFARTEAESNEKVTNPATGKIGQPKPHIVNKVQDLGKLGWTNQQIEDIIHNRD